MESEVRPTREQFSHEYRPHRAPRRKSIRRPCLLLYHRHVENGSQARLHRRTSETATTSAIRAGRRVDSPTSLPAPRHHSHVRETARSCNGKDTRAMIPPGGQGRRSYAMGRTPGAHRRLPSGVRAALGRARKVRGRGRSSSAHRFPACRDSESSAAIHCWIFSNGGGYELAELMVCETAHYRN